MLIRRETRSDLAGVRDVTAAAFGKSEAAVPVEVTLLDELRTCDAWLPALSFVAADDRGDVIGHVVCTRGHVGPDLALGLGPLSVHPTHQRRDLGLATDGTGSWAQRNAFAESLVALLGSPAYYGRFGFRPAAAYGITAPDPAWGDYFQARPLTAYQPTLKGPFAYAEPFDRV
ncbi:acetyltransferase, GNAT family protein [Streptomyces himastatinicus ATCC 53653]|uniref:Acetyltransferase, GNAT family protein n=1 Tax=Streptomyces himastatinicus ATCC 53653 TaxID=457427 RepID=D9WRU0_9ACTN|nr:N-acetyltransferase [Streptomyces himastatinicus]EFL26210.1 acetyltransferase, GNAT family protein [Streptomyces himastatinicus ATCC 53653]